jgi:enamine deaminase RidA (YjgF/YER057c/UK114 family)
MATQNPIGRFINPATIAQPPGYTHVVEVTQGKTVYISGQVSLDPDGKLVGQDDMQAQTRQVFANLQSALEAVGANFSNVVKLNYYLLEMTQLPVVREVRNQPINPAKPPASTAVEVRRLAQPDFLLEIEAVAIIPA